MIERVFLQILLAFVLLCKQSVPLMLQGMETEDSAAQSIVGTCTDGTASVPQIRRSVRIRKRFTKRRRV